MGGKKEEMYIKRLLEAMGLPGAICVIRRGEELVNKQEVRGRPVTVTLDLESSSHKILKTAKNLKGIVEFSGIFINCDKSKKEREKSKNYNQKTKSGDTTCDKMMQQPLKLQTGDEH